MILAITTVSLVAETTNDSVSANAQVAISSRNLDDSAFRIVAERNIFDANRSGGQVRLSSSRRPARVESFTLVGTMAYTKGAFAFFAGSNAELTKTLKAGGVIAGHKIVDVLANAVNLEADGKVFELPIGSAMRREDEGTWHLGEGVVIGTGATASNRENNHFSRSDRSDSGSRYSRRGSNSDNAQPELIADSKHERKDFKKEEKEDKQERKELKKELKAESESEILKRLMERREKESQ